MQLSATDPLALTVISAIHAGRLDDLRNLLASNPDLPKARIVDGKGVARTLLHIASDWPGHFPDAAASVTILIGAGADPNAVVKLPTGDGAVETPLHWAASSDDVAVLDALLDGGADLEAPGAVFTGGTAMSDAVVFAQWKAARQLLERGAQTTLWQSAALGIADRVHRRAASSNSSTGCWSKVPERPRICSSTRLSPREATSSYRGPDFQSREAPSLPVSSHRRRQLVPPDLP
ncbi:MAG TPA: ankyrin repeat domain-containing protein [Thermoanaerobaculia bacterium]|nr:ankyrin repeat domain-containing protein [Thermoanaerobaculia bacterium]